MNQESKKARGKRKAKEFTHRELEELMGKYKSTLGRSGRALKHNRRSVIQ